MIEKQEFNDIDLKGRKIEQRSKDSRSVEINGDSRFCGHRFLLRQKLYGDKRCIYCGKWFHWKQDDAAKWVKSNNIDNMNVDKVLEPLHCGTMFCDDYHQAYLKHQEKLAAQQQALQEHRTMEMFKAAKAAGIIS
jgi:hypothetical protein